MPHRRPVTPRRGECISPSCALGSGQAHSPVHSWVGTWAGTSQKSHFPFGICTPFDSVSWTQVSQPVQTASGSVQSLLHRSDAQTEWQTYMVSCKDCTHRDFFTHTDKGNGMKLLLFCMCAMMNGRALIVTTVGLSLRRRRRRWTTRATGPSTGLVRRVESISCWPAGWSRPSRAERRGWSRCCPVGPWPRRHRHGLYTWLGIYRWVRPPVLAVAAVWMGLLRSKIQTGRITGLWFSSVAVNNCLA